MSDDRWSQIEQFFIQDEWPIQQIGENKRWMRTGFKGKNGQWTCYVNYIEHLDVVLFYSISPLTVPEDRRYAMAEFITRANYGMYIGNFEMDFDDGEVRYKSSLDVEDTELSFDMFKNILYPNVMTMDKYLPGLMSVAFSNTTPVDAIAGIEQED